MAKTKILIISANPWDTKRIGIDEEYREIEKVWEASKDRNDFELKYKPAASDTELRKALLDFEPDILHFSGHGELDGLCFQHSDGNTQFITQDALSRLFSLFSKRIKCVVLNACYSAEQAHAIAQHIDAVIGMSQAIGDTAAIKFSEGFYQALFNGREFEFAFDFGCSTIDLSGIPEWQTPQLIKKQDNSQTVKSFLTQYQTDVLIHTTETEKQWAEGFAFELEKYLKQKLNNQSFRIVLQTDALNVQESATYLILLSAEYSKQHQQTLAQLKTMIQQKRLFLADYNPTSRPETLHGLLSYLFWKADSLAGFRNLTTQDSDYFLQIENIAQDIVMRLQQLKNEYLVSKEINTIKQNISNLSTDALVFVNIAPEDTVLTEQVHDSLQQHGIGYAFPAITHNAKEMRDDIENKLLQCDAVLLIYERGSPAWIDFQLLTCSKTLRKREEPFKIIAVHTEASKAKFNVHLPNIDLQLFYCPPENIKTYLPRFIEALK